MIGVSEEKENMNEKSEFFKLIPVLKSYQIILLSKRLRIDNIESKIANI
jgi:hypothetical protein